MESGDKSPHSKESWNHVMLLHNLLVCLLPALAGAEPPEVLPRGHVFYAADFEAGDALKGWTGPAAPGEGYQGGHALVLERPARKAPATPAPRSRCRWPRCAATWCSSRPA